MAASNIVKGVLGSNVAAAAAPAMRLLVVEAFAGSYTVGRYLADRLHKQTQGTQGAPNSDGFQLAAYAAIELEPKFHAKAAGAGQLGLSPSSYLNVNGSASDFGVHSQLLRFVSSRLQSDPDRISGVVVFGGPPCTAYSNASRQPEQTKLECLEREYEHALTTYAMYDGWMGGSGQLSDPEDQEDAEKARDKVEATARAITRAIEAAAAEAAVNTRSALQSDSLVKSFLSLFRAIQVECWETQQIPSFLLMENPYSIPDRSLWNRPFMREHLTRLPNRPAAQALPFRRTRQGWLNPVFQNWCTYGPNYPKKDSVIFTNLPEGALPDRFCRDHCQRPDGARKHAAAVLDLKNAHERAKWPIEYVGEGLQACARAIHNGAIGW